MEAISQPDAGERADPSKLIVVGLCSRSRNLGRGRPGRMSLKKETEEVM
jgi:hypothetical protein